jgi:small subunit ribosomal protein S20
LEEAVANHQQAAKRNRQRVKKQALGRHFKSTMRTHIKRVRAALEANDAKAAQDALTQAIPVIDHCAQKGFVPRERASRFISRLTIAVNRGAQQ